MVHLIDKDALVAKIDVRRHNIMIGIATIPLRGRQRADAAFEYEILGRVRDSLDTLEVKDIGVDLGDPKGDKSAKYIIDTKTLEVKEVDLEEIIKYHFDIKNINDVKITTTGENLLNLAMRINKFVMNTAFEQYRQIGENTGNESLDEEIEKTIKMNDMWCGLMPNTLIKYTARHFFELGMSVNNKAQKGE